MRGGMMEFNATQKSAKDKFIELSKLEEEEVNVKLDKLKKC